MAEKKFNLADAVRQSVGEASIATMNAAAVQTGERTIENITSEILHYQAVGGDAVVQIGKRLIEAKELLPHGGWLPWLSEQVNYSERTAQRLMKIARDCSNPTLVSDLGRTKALALLALPDEEQKALLEAYDVPNMSKRELEDAIRERDEARKTVEALNEQVKTLEEHNTDLETRALNYSNQNDDLKERIKELESAPKEVYKDEAAIKAAADEARRKTVEEWQKKHEKLVADLEKAESKLKEAKEKAKIDKADVEAGNKALADLDAAKKAEAEAKAEADRLRAELAEAQKAAKAAAVAGDAEVSEFKLYFGLAQENINKMCGLLLKVRSREDKTTGEKLAAAMTALADAVKEAAK